MSGDSSVHLVRLKDTKRRTAAMYRDVRYSQLADDDDSDEQEILTHSRKQPQEENVFIRTIQPDDTLQSIALQYYVPVSELKRINNIIRDNEIHARTTLKIPRRPITSLVDLTPETPSPAPQPESELVKLRIGSGCNPTDFLAAMDRDLAKIRAAVPQVESAAPPSEIMFNATPPSNLINSCSGSDWGLRWQHILMFSLVFTLSLPLFIWYNQHHSAAGASKAS
ncbi:lysM and putative peptidoglycan-binding domain-containing protein 4-like [Neocloeon triangulifer]|uniref:lysM and putative peptidoglycan-binding domain-containing protein 4-like n=1 Tax=Neocloeon triangulifer TaxID=2078957 RepID=UPI00286F2B36|nr:lysM and putative peptidoglycan-binding domain-containing protein 4-like [Neocloeon triangulifer]XP_059486334.1 lysM and putative peptidoglycan-binding domain-containing protein 4-like [Neocloeon triangulifer]XP_059486336.1 lysM and putative peptidoglycan-binding domain-containing protein 4-like [Neocloeon triangulifer]XP_059486337.1 lysM and putative peptidoglycan-binding domain-containing protein 4-like [Neocloeon triangulifer]XP_059486338.1 lysM and putative peptidoglycan-binding domain-c